jgi:hypothetical protein
MIQHGVKSLRCNVPGARFDSQLKNAAGSQIFCRWKSSKKNFGRLPSPLKEQLQGGALNRGLKRIFSLYKPSCHIEAYIRPEKNCFVWAGPLANHHSILTSF